MFDREEDLSLLLDVIKEEYFFYKIRNAADKIGKVSQKEFDSIVNAIAEEFIKFAAEEDEVTDKKGEYSFSLSGYDINTWMDYWFGISEKGTSLKDNGVFFSTSEERINNLRNRIDTLSKRFGYEVSSTKDPKPVQVYGKKSRKTPPDIQVDSPKFEISGDPFEGINDFARDVNTLSSSSDKKYLSEFVKKYKDIVYKQFKADPSKLFEKIPAEGRKSYKTELVGLLKDNIEKLQSELYSPEGVSGKNVGFMSLTTEPAEGQGTSGRAVEKETKIDLNKAEVERLDRNIEILYNGLNALIEDQKALIQENQTINESIKNNEIDPKYDVQTKLQSIQSNLDNVSQQINSKKEEISKAQKNKEKLVSYRTKNLEHITGDILSTEELIERYESILKKLISTGNDITKEDLNDPDVYSYILRRLGQMDKDVFEESLFPKETDNTFSKYIDDLSKGNIESIPDDYFENLKSKIEDIAKKRIEFKVAERESSKAIIDRVINVSEGLISHYLASKQYIEAKKEGFIKELTEFNSAESVKNKAFGDMHNSFQGIDKLIRSRESGYTSLYDKFYKDAERNLGGLSSEYNTLVRSIPKDFPQEIVKPFKDNNKKITLAVEDVLNFYNSYTPAGEDEQGNISDKDLDFYRRLNYKNRQAVNIIEESKNLLDVMEKTSEGLTKDYRNVLNIVLRYIKTAPTEAFTVKNKSDLSTKKEGTEMMMTALKNMKGNKQFTVNSFISMLNLFDSIGEYKGIINTQSLIDIANAKRKRIDDISGDIEKSINPLSQIMNNFFKKDTLVNMNNTLNTTVQDDVKNLIGDKSDFSYSQESIQNFILSEFSSKYKLTPKIIEDIHNALHFDPVYSESIQNMSGVGFDTYTKVPRSQIPSSEWNSLYILNDWKSLVNQCTRSLKSCKSTAAGTFNPAHAEYAPQIDYSKKMEESKKTDYIAHPGKSTEKSEDVSKLKRFGGVTGTSSLALTFSEKTRDHQRQQLVDNFIFLMDEFENYLRKEKTDFPKTEKYKDNLYANLLNNAEEVFRSLKSSKDLNLETIVGNKTKLFDTIEKANTAILERKGKDYKIISMDDVSELYKAAELVNFADKTRPDNKIVFKYLYSPESLTEDERKKSKEIISFMTNYLDTTQKSTYKPSKPAKLETEERYFSNNPNIPAELTAPDAYGWPGISIVRVPQDSKLREKRRIPGNVNFVVTKPVSMTETEVKSLPREIQEKYKQMVDILGHTYVPK